MTPDEDRVLLERAQQGDAQAFEALVERHTRRVYNLALRMTGSAHDAQELTQETFLSAFQNLGAFRGDAAFGSWVHRIAANLALMRLRHRKVVQEAEEELKVEPTALPLSHFGKQADAEVLDHELRTAIERAIAGLPEGHRAVFLLKDMEDLSYEEIAQAVGITVPAVKSRLHRARLALRQAIDAFYAGRAS